MRSDNNNPLLLPFLKRSRARPYSFSRRSDGGKNQSGREIRNCSAVFLRPADEARGWQPGLAGNSNVAADGSVDWDEDFLTGFDLCVASV